MENRQKIEDNFPNIYRHIFEYPDLRLVCLDEKRNYVNSYRSLPIQFADGTSQEEQVFSCFTVDRNSGEINHYFLSKEYNVAEHMVDPSPMAARFVFRFESSLQRFILFTMAEESARDRLGFAELHYLKYRENSELSECIIFISFIIQLLQVASYTEGYELVGED